MMQPYTSTVISRDNHVFIFSSSAVTVAARLLVTWLLIALLLVPVVVIHIIKGVALQILCIMIALAVFVFVLLDMMYARMAEIFVAGAM